MTSNVSGRTPIRLEVSEQNFPRFAANLTRRVEQAEPRMSAHEFVPRAGAGNHTPVDERCRAKAALSELPQVPTETSSACVPVNVQGGRSRLSTAASRGPTVAAFTRVPDNRRSLSAYPPWFDPPGGREECVLGGPSEKGRRQRPERVFAVFEDGGNGPMARHWRGHVSGHRACSNLA